MMAYNGLDEFVQDLDRIGGLKRINYPVKAELEIVEIADRVLKANGLPLFLKTWTMHFYTKRQ
jgi:4-hydroxy-3-polyprenylbenzoate decarboxylase